MTAPRLPNDSDFARIVRHAPLVSIDVLLKDPEEYVLLGLRVNEPARGKYFVPSKERKATRRLFAHLEG